MEEKKKKKLTLGVSSKTSHNVSNYVKSSKKTSVLIEKKSPRRWEGKKFQFRNNKINKPESTDSFAPKKPSIKNVSKPIKKPGKNAQISGSLKVIFNSDQGFIIADPKFGIK